MINERGESVVSERAYKRIYNRLWNLKNPEKYKEQQRRWRLAHPEAFRAIQQRWRERNPEAVAAMNERNKLKQRVVKTVGICLYCDAPFEARKGTIYCSKKCAQRHWDNVPLIKQRIVVCLFCGITFESSCQNDTSKFCSKEHRDHYRNLLRKEARKLLRAARYPSSTPTPHQDPQAKPQSQ